VKKNSSLKNKKTERKGGEKMDKNGLRLAARFSWNCETAKSKDVAISEDLKDFIKKSQNGETLIKEKLANLKTFGHYKNIACLNRVENIFDARVVSSYWLGYPEMKGNIYHNYTTLEPILKIQMDIIHPETINECFVHAAKVTGIKKDSLVVEYRPVVKNDNKLVLSNPRAKEVKNTFAIKRIWKGCHVAIHFSDTVGILNSEELEVLRKITLQSLVRFNSARTS